jgi:hypothetical protein
LTNGNDADHSAKFSPDGKQLAFVRGDSELRTIDMATKADRTIARGLFDRPPLCRRAAVCVVIGWPVAGVPVDRSQRVHERHGGIDHGRSSAAGQFRGELLREHDFMGAQR